MSGEAKRGNSHAFLVSPNTELGTAIDYFVSKSGLGKGQWMLRTFMILAEPELRKFYVETYGKDLYDDHFRNVNQTTLERKQQKQKRLEWKTKKVETENDLMFELESLEEEPERNFYDWVDTQGFSKADFNEFTNRKKLKFYNEWKIVQNDQKYLEFIQQNKLTVEPKPEEKEGVDSDYQTEIKNLFQFAKDNMDEFKGFLKEKGFDNIAMIQPFKLQAFMSEFAMKKGQLVKKEVVELDETEESKAEENDFNEPEEEEQ